MSLAFGLTADDPAALGAFTAATGVTPSISAWFRDWSGEPAFDAARADAARRCGALPLVTWEPWTAGRGPDQPEYALARIAAGDHDDRVTAVAEQVRDWGGHLALRFLHELDAPHYPWGAGVNGNTPDHAVAAWRHVRRLFRAVGAHDVTWIWCVNAPGSVPYRPLYPGDEWVDWVAVDGYNGGSAMPWGGWRSPDDVFLPALTDLRRTSGRPLVIAEVACAEQGGDKARWIHRLFELAVEHDVRALVWFDHDKETDWRVASSPAAFEAVRREVRVAGRLGPPP
ncbi:glycoside hydrolase family 26 protein [Actinomycetospora straminea]|uniref:GH26 domain-containing protein n=1 Tax=Actinomycetospora straminea TaxID=663607 RepID=A0ABP9EY46_9PSEU|nr:glycosyl hydrolase [Actinomycetospora straminea]MDD7932967.1 glycosyl hydrolase [Actinomycetospora straminea]